MTQEIKKPNAVETAAIAEAIAEFFVTYWKNKASPTEIRETKIN